MKSRPRPPRRMRKTKTQHVVFLLDVDNTLLDNDRVTVDLRRYLEREAGLTCQRQYWKIFEQLDAELGYADYLGALQRYRIDHAHDHDLLSISSYLMNYPFANRLCPHSRREWATRKGREEEGEHTVFATGSIFSRSFATKAPTYDV